MEFDAPSPPCAAHALLVLVRQLRTCASSGDRFTVSSIHNITAMLMLSSVILVTAYMHIAGFAVYPVNITQQLMFTYACIPLGVME